MGKQWYLLVVVVVLAAGCGGATPSSPTTPPPVVVTPPPPAPSSWTLAGTAVDAVTGAPISGASVAFAKLSTVTSNAGGAWTMTGTGPVDASQPLKVSAPGYVTHDTRIRWQSDGRTSLDILLFPDAAPYSLAFYRDLVRNAFEAPDHLEPLRRWTVQPNFYINTFNPKTNQPIDAAELALVVNAIQQSVPQLTGGSFTASTIESGNGARAPRVGYVNVSFSYEPKGDYCGYSQVGTNPGAIVINYDRCASVCGSLKISPEVVAHEVGHAMGFWHTKADGLMSATKFHGCANASFSPDARLHARLAYLRPPGNLDVDVDPDSFLAVVAPDPAPVIYCRR
jgi:Carboxypeptidase regulatory-like domain